MLWCLLALISCTLTQTMKSCDDAPAVISPKDQAEISRILHKRKVDNLPGLIQQYPVLKKPHIESESSVIFMCLRADHPYPSQQLPSLLSLGVPIDQTNKYKQTALWQAYEYDHFSMIKQLLNHKADPCCGHTYGYTPLDKELERDSPNFTTLWTFMTHPSFASMANNPRIASTNTTYLTKVLKLPAVGDETRTGLVRGCLQAGVRARPEDLDLTTLASLRYLLKRDLKRQPWSMVLLDPAPKEQEEKRILNEHLVAILPPTSVRNTVLAYVGLNSSPTQHN